MVRIKIIGTGISGLMITYHLAQMTKKAEIEITLYDRNEDGTVDNASTHSLAWLNALYPSKDNHKEFDRYRIKSLEEWEVLIQDLSDAGIETAREEQRVVLDNKHISSIYVHNAASFSNFRVLSSRFQDISPEYVPDLISVDSLSHAFPFLSSLKSDEMVCNIEMEQVINPKALRHGLIKYLESKGIIFKWGVNVTHEDLEKEESDVYWIIAAGADCETFTRKGIIKDFDFADSSTVNVIYCQLEEPLNLNGAVIHFAQTDILPGFRVRNDENDIYRLKILVEFIPGDFEKLQRIAPIILDKLGVTAKETVCDSSVNRPQTKDGKPVVEIGKVSLVFGHGLFSNAKLFKDMANALAQYINHAGYDVFVNPDIIDINDLYAMDRFAKLALSAPPQQTALRTT